MDDRQLTAATSDAKSARLVYVGLVALVAIGLAASTALLIDYMRPLPLFCSEAGGCGQLRQSQFAQFGPIKTPVIGVVGFLVLASLTLARGPIARFLHLVVASMGALVGGMFLFLQVKLSTFCVYCMFADLSVILTLGLVLMRVRLEADGFSASRGAPNEARARRETLIVGSIFATAIMLPFIPHFIVKTPVPAVIADEMRKTPPGQVTVVDFIDFECPFCRQTAVDFEPTLAKYRGKVRLVRKQVPLVNKHPHALVAARAACCAEQMGLGDEMAARLVSMPPDDLTEDGCASAARGLGLDEGAFRSCMRAATTQAQIDADQADFKAAKGHALPTIWIGTHQIVGAAGPDELREAMEKAIKEVGG